MAKTNIQTEAKQIEQTPEEKRLAHMSAVIKDCTTWSAKFRALSAAGYKTGEIAKFTGKLYQHVRNVLKQPLKGSAPSTGSTTPVAAEVPNKQ